MALLVAAVVVQRDGSLDWSTLGFGGGNGKVRMTTNLAGQGSSARVTGGYASGNRQHLDYDTLQEHAASTPSPTSLSGRPRRPLHRRLAGNDQGRRRCPAAPTPSRSAATCCSPPTRTRTPSPASRSSPTTSPCTHAAAIAQVDKDQLFYLDTQRSRRRRSEVNGRRRLPRSPGGTPARRPGP